MLAEKFSKTLFNLVHRRNLIYNTCWEDPRLDRVALELTPEDNILMITSAGCNALDYALCEPNHIHAVDMNPIQNAVLELKMAAIRELDYEPFYRMFGQGCLQEWDTVYSQALRPHLTAKSKRYWDKRGKFFNGKGKRKSFYFRGTSGMFAWWVNRYIKHIAKIRKAVNEILEAETVEAQKEIYYNGQLSESLWKPFVLWALRRDATLAMLGVPRGQRKQLDNGYPGGIAEFVKDRIEDVFTRLPLKDNYFWRVYLTGQYTTECCPEYLKPDNFERLKSGLVDRISTHTDSILGFLIEHPGSISRYVLLDHMDWLCNKHEDILAAEWQAIFDKAAPASRVIWRSAGLTFPYLNNLEMPRDGHKQIIGKRLQHHPELATELHAKDRVNTYGSFYIADLLPA